MIIGAVAAGLGAFVDELGRQVEGVLRPPSGRRACASPSTSAPGRQTAARRRARVLPTLSAGMGTSHIEYPSAQAYAAVLMALHCVQDIGSLDDGALAAVARRLRCTTFFGRSGSVKTAGSSTMRSSWSSGVPG